MPVYRAKPFRASAMHGKGDNGTIRKTGEESVSRGYGEFGRSRNRLRSEDTGRPLSPFVGEKQGEGRQNSLLTEILPPTLRERV